MMCNEQAYSLAVEKLLNIQPPPRAQWIRGKPRPGPAPRPHPRAPRAPTQPSLWPSCLLSQCCLGRSHGF